DSGHLRRRQGGQVRLVSIPAPPGRSRPQWRATHHLRCLPRSDGKRRRVSARRSVAALHGSFLSEHLQPCAGHQGPRSESHAQSHPFPGEPQRSRPQGPRDRRRPAGRPDEHRGRSGRAQRPRDADLLRFSRHPLAQDPHQQPARTDHARDPSTDSCCRCIPRWPVMPQAGPCAESQWTYDGVEEWLPLTRDAVQYPQFSEQFNEIAPARLRGFSPPFLTPSIQPGGLQVWTGCIAKSAPGWSLLVRGVANLFSGASYQMFEGIIETDNWFGPLFNNVRIIKTDMPIEFRSDIPFLQVQPVHKDVYAEKFLQNFAVKD